MWCGVSNSLAYFVLDVFNIQSDVDFWHYNTTFDLVIEAL